MRRDATSGLFQTGVPTLVCALALAALASCSVSGDANPGGENGVEPATSSASGSVIKGAVSGGMADVFELLAQGAVGAKVGEGPVRGGAFSADLGEFEGSVLIEVSEGTYMEEADGEPISLADFPDVPLSSVAAGVEIDADTTVNLTPFTTVAAAIVRDSANRCADVTTLIADALMRTARFFRGDLDGGTEVDLLEVTPADLTAAVDDPCSDETLLGAWNAGLSELGLDRGVSALVVLGALIEDVGDGIFDGFDVDGLPIEVAEAPIGGDFATVQLADAIEQFLGSDMNGSGIGPSDLAPGGAAECLGADIDALRDLGDDAPLLGPAAVVFPAGQDEGPFVVDDLFELRLDFIDLFGAAQGTLTLPLDPTQLEADCDTFVPGEIPAERFDAICDVDGTVTVTIAPGPPIPGGCGELFTVTLLSVGPADPAQIAIGDIDLHTAANVQIEVTNLASTERTIRPNDPPDAVIAGPAPSDVLALRDFVLDGSGSSDPNGDDLGFSWEDLSGLLTIADPAGESTTVTPADVMVNTPATVRLTVDDGRSADSQDSSEFTLTIIPENDAPVVNVVALPSGVVGEQTPVMLDATGSTDPNQNNLSFEWRQTGGPLVGNLAGENTETLSFTTPPLVQDAIITFELEVTDDHPLDPLMTVEEVTVSVRNLNDPPTAVVAPVGPVPEFTSVTLDGSDSNDPNPGTLLRFQWTQTGGTQVELSGATTAVATFTAPAAPDTLTFELTVSDSRPLMSTAEVTVEVSAGRPVADAGDDFSVAEGAEDVKLDGSQSFDSDGGDLAFQWMQNGEPPVALAGANTSMPTFDAPPLDPDGPDTVVLSFKLEVTDPDQLTDSDEVEVTVARDNDPPMAVVAPVEPLEPEETVDLDGTGSSDPNPGETATLTFEWTQKSGPPVTLEGADTPTPSFTAPVEEGVVVLELTVTDTGSPPLSDTEEVSVTVRIPPTARITLGVDGGTAIDITVFTVSFDPDDFEPIPVDPDDPSQGFRVEDAGAGGIPLASQPSPGEMEITHISLLGYDGPGDVADLFLTVRKSEPVSCSDFAISVEARDNGVGIPGVGVTCSAALE